MSKIRFRMVLAVMVTIVGFASVGYAQTNKLKFTSLDFPGGNLTTGRGIQQSWRHRRCLPCESSAPRLTDQEGPIYPDCA